MRHSRRLTTISSIPRSEADRRVFVDTSAFAALFNGRDANHVQAKKIWGQMIGEGVPAVTSLFVIDETITLLQRRAGHSLALAFAERSLQQRFLPVLDVTDPVLAGALDYFRRSSALEFSFTDCTSFALMSREGLDVAFAFDEDFRRAGFRTL